VTEVVPGRPEDEGRSESAFTQPQRVPDPPPSSPSARLHDATGTASIHAAFRAFVPGEPKPQGSMNGFSLGGRIQIVHAKSTDLAVWRHAVTATAFDLWGENPALDEPVAVFLDFFLAKPKSATKKRYLPDRRPDLDKLTRAVLDALTGIVFVDDARIVTLLAHKFYASGRPTGVAISVRSVGE
jgi:crossover junction endodeoxyribonuclease RusA